MKLQDLLHELEFAKGESEKHKVATKFRNSRKKRRENKDTVLMLENLVSFCEEPQNKKVIEQLRQMLGRQRKQEDYLKSERTYFKKATK